MPVFLHLKSWKLSAFASLATQKENGSAIPRKAKTKIMRDVEVCSKTLFVPSLFRLYISKWSSKLFVYSSLVVWVELEAGDSRTLKHRQAPPSTHWHPPGSWCPDRRGSPPGRWPARARRSCPGAWGAGVRSRPRTGVPCAWAGRCSCRWYSLKAVSQRYGLWERDIRGNKMRRTALDRTALPTSRFTKIEWHLENPKPCVSLAERRKTLQITSMNQC